MRAYPRASACKRVRHIGIETEIEVVETIEKGHRLEQQGMLYRNAGYFVEWRTIPIRVDTLHTEKGAKVVKSYFDNMKPGTRVVDEQGTHIHISILSNDNPNLEANVLALTAAFYEEFQKVSGRRTTWARRPGIQSIAGAKREVARMKIRHKPRSYNRQYLMITPSYYQTLEFRGPVGSNDGDEVLAWSQFLENVVKACNKDSVGKIKFADLLKGERIEGYVKSFDDWRKLSRKELNKTFNEAKLA